MLERISMTPGRWLVSVSASMLAAALALAGVVTLLGQTLAGFAF